MAICRALVPEVPADTLELRNGNYAVIQHNETDFSICLRLSNFQAPKKRFIDSTIHMLEKKQQ